LAAAKSDVATLAAATTPSGSPLTGFGGSSGGLGFGAGGPYGAKGVVGRQLTFLVLGGGAGLYLPLFVSSTVIAVIAVIAVIPDDATKWAASITGLGDIT
jgi:hypothetical protein